MQTVSPTTLRLNPTEPLGNLAIIGTPKVLRASDNAYPTGVRTNAGGLEFDWATPATEPDTFTLGPNDPTVRTQQGAYIAPFTWTSPTPPTPPAPFIIVSGTQSLGVAFLVTNANVEKVFVKDLPAVLNETTANMATNVYASDVQLIADFAGLLSPGDVISITDADPDMRTGNGGLSAASSVTVT